MLWHTFMAALAALPPVYAGSIFARSTNRTFLCVTSGTGPFVAAAAGAVVVEAVKGMPAQPVFQSVFHMVLHEVFVNAHTCVGIPFKASRQQHAEQSLDGFHAYA